MSVRHKSSINKQNYEISGQLAFFGRDILSFKSVNLPDAQRYKDLCKQFKLKKIVCKSSLLLDFINFCK